MAICLNLFHLVPTFSSRSWAESGLHPLVLRKCHPGCTERVVAKLVNFSLTQYRVPLVWKTVHITPVPKTSPVTGAGDLRLISVTSILTRTVEKVVVRNYLTPLLRSSLFYDQYAYKPTGSTTCALADLTYRISHFAGV